jgi:hypothetical protein
MAKKEVTAREYVDRLLDEEPETVTRILAVIRDASELHDLMDTDLFYDWFTSPVSYDELEDELKKRIGKLQTLANTLKQRSPIDIPKPKIQPAAN